MFTKIEKTPFAKEKDFSPLRAALEKIENKVKDLPKGNTKKAILENILSQCKIYINDYNTSLKKTGAEEVCKDLIKANLLCDLCLLFLRIPQTDIATLNTDRSIMTATFKLSTYATSVIGSSVVGGMFGGPLGLFAGVFVGHKSGRALVGVKTTDSINILLELIESTHKSFKNDVNTYGLNVLEENSVPEIIWEESNVKSVPLSWRPTLCLTFKEGQKLNCRFLLHNEELNIIVNPYLKIDEIAMISKLQKIPAESKLENVLKIACLKALNAQLLAQSLHEESNALTSVSPVGFVS
ncbi:hypothetical protein [uncultured Legionella sp.]|uniref:hypothetical protein n=1 Tax=uncultured Legionella sp. TaxID=210934 RepID=UPI00262B35FA|nr:hypothetical protein [uncultured Legionella sp.]